MGPCNRNPKIKRPEIWKVFLLIDKCISFTEELIQGLEQKKVPLPNNMLCGYKIQKGLQKINK
jgi:hypothetical protein